MAVRFVIGRAGSGKTQRCLRLMADALREEPLGGPIYWILPRQATFQAERELTCGSGLAGFCRARVVSLQQLVKEVAEECGGSAVPEVTELGRQMILGHLLRQNEGRLRFFSKVARHPGLAAQLDATLTEIERCGKGPEDLEKLAAAMEADRADAEAEPLAAKLHDLHLIYREYYQYIGQERLDPGRRLRQVLENIGRSRRLAGATVYVDEFWELDEPQRRILAKLGKVAGRMEVMLLMDSVPAAQAKLDDLGLFHRIQRMYRKLAKAMEDEGAVVEEMLVLGDPKRFATPALAEIERGLFELVVLDSAGDPSRVTLVEAPDRRAEVEHAASHIRALLAGGLRLRDIAVLVRRADLYGDLINAAFREHEVPFFMDRRRPMGHHPLLQFVRAALAIAQGLWPHEAMMVLTKTGLAGLSADEADRLENYVLEHRLRGAVWAREEPWIWRRRFTTAEEAEDPLRDESAQVDALRRRVVEAMGAFVDGVGDTTEVRAGHGRDARGALTVRRIVVELFQLLGRFGVRATLANWIDEARKAAEHEQAGEHEQVWRKLVELFDEMVELLGDQPVTVAQFQDVLDSALETFDLALAPPTVDQVLVGQVDRTRTPAVKAVLLLGMNDGIFPYAPRDTSILSDPERETLQERQFEVDDGTERRLLDEELLGYIAFTRASERLYLSRSVSDEAGRPLGPSIFWERLRALFPTLAVRVLPRDERTDPEMIGTPRQALTAVMKWAREARQKAKGERQNEEEEEGPWAALYQWLAGYETNDDAVDRLRFWAWRALAYDNAAAVSAEIGGSLFPRPLRAGVSQIETFAACPFKHFVRYGLGLEERDEAEFEAINLDGAFHQILENLVRDMLQSKGDWQGLSAAQAEEMVRTYAAEAEASIRGQMMLSNARNRYLLDRIRRTLGQVIATQQAAAARGAFRTAAARVDFGFEHGALPPLVVQTPGGNVLHLRGRIDRVDVCEGEGAFAVFDYRLGGGDLNLCRVHHGLSLQLLTCLLAVKEHAAHLAGKALSPAAAFYVKLLRHLERVKHPADALDASDPNFPLKVKQRGIFDGRFLAALDNQVEGSSDVVAARLKKDGTFGYKNTSDVAEGEELEAMLAQVRRNLGKIADQILEGQIELRPYRMGTETPCPQCRYRGVCRFDPAINRYRHINGMDRESVLAEAMKGVGDGK